MTKIEITTQQVDALLEMFEAEDKSWESICEAGRIAAQDMDTHRLTLGALALLVVKEYGEDRLGQFAIQINMDKKRVQEYRRVVGFYGGKTACADILEELPILSYSHLRVAMKLETREEAIKFLEECASEGWTIEQAMLKLKERLGKEQKPSKLGEILVLVESMERKALTRTRGKDMQSGMGNVVTISYFPETLKWDLEKGKLYRLVVYEGVSDADGSD